MILGMLYTQNFSGYFLADLPTNRLQVREKMNINRLVSLAALVVWTFAATTTGTAGEQNGAVDEALAAMDAEPTTTVTAFEAALDANACENWCSSGCDCDLCGCDGCDGWSLFGTNFRSTKTA